MNLQWGQLGSLHLPCKIKTDTGKTYIIEKNDREVRVTAQQEGQPPSVNRFICASSDNIFLEPMLPDLPVVIKPDTVLTILPDRTLQTFILVPLVVLVSCGNERKRENLMEISYTDLSRSWFGDPDNGEISYFLESSFPVSRDSCPEELPVICCPVSVSNKSGQPLTLERMILRVPSLSIYRGKKKFYTNKTRITFRGQDQISQITYGKSAPDLEQDVELVKEPRNKDDGSVLQKSFYFIRTLYNG